MELDYRINSTVLSKIKSIALIQTQWNLLLHFSTLLIHFSGMSCHLNCGPDFQGQTNALNAG